MDSLPARSAVSLRVLGRPSRPGNAAMTVALAQGQVVPVELIAPMQDHSPLLGDAVQLRRQFAESGYLYLKGLFDRSDIVAAREAVFARLAAVGEIRSPPVEGVFSGESRRNEMTEDLGQFWKSVSETWSLRRLSHGTKLQALMSAALGDEAIAQDYIFLRPASPGKFTHVHCDYPFFTRTTESVATAWIALGDVPVEEGPLFVLEGSHRFDDMVESYRGFDVASDTSRKAALAARPDELARERGCHILTQDFAAGDVVIFGMFLLHGALDNASERNRVRLSCDVRYQLSAADKDPRYFGPEPTGTTGAGYGELVGAKPMTDDWHVR